MQGKSVKFDRARGFGFIWLESDPTFPDIYCHFSDIQRTSVWRRQFLLPGMTVEFDIEYPPDDPEHDRPRAKNIKVVPPITISIQRSTRAAGSRR